MSPQMKPQGFGDLFPSCLLLQKTVYPGEVHLGRSLRLDPQGLTAILSLPPDQSPTLPLGAGRAPPQ